MADLNKMTKKEFLAIEEIEDATKVEFDSFVIIPTGRAHESHYGCMKYVLICGHEIIGIVSEQVQITIDAEKLAIVNQSIFNAIDGDYAKARAAMDCLRTSRLIHFFLKQRVRTPWPVYSAFNIQTKG